MICLQLLLKNTGRSGNGAPPTLNFRCGNRRKNAYFRNQGPVARVWRLFSSRNVPLPSSVDKNEPDPPESLCGSRTAPTLPATGLHSREIRYIASAALSRAITGLSQVTIRIPYFSSLTLHQRLNQRLNPLSYQFGGDSLSLAHRSRTNPMHGIITM